MEFEIEKKGYSTAMEMGWESLPEAETVAELQR